jgi:putative transposase
MEWTHRQVTDDWMQLYNYERPHDGLNDMTPIEYLNANLILYV